MHATAGERDCAISQTACFDEYECDYCWLSVIPRTLFSSNDSYVIEQDCNNWPVIDVK